VTLMTQIIRRALFCLISISAAFTPAFCQKQGYTFNVVAGHENPYFCLGTGDGSPNIGGAAAKQCYDVALDEAGNLYTIVGSLIRKLNPDGTISTVAGGGSSLQDYVPATQAKISPIAIASDAAGALYIADKAPGGSRIRKIDTQGKIATIAGGVPCCALGDGGTATRAYIGTPNGVAVDATGNIYIAQADGQNNLVRKVSAASGTISTVAGGGSGTGDGGAATAISLSRPTGVAVDAEGNLYVAEADGHRVRKVSSAGVISTLAGNGAATTAGDGGPATQAGVNSPWHVAVDPGGNIFITEINEARVRLVTPDGTITTIAGNGQHGFSGDGGPATSATLDRPGGIAVSSRSGAVYIADATSGIASLTLSGSPLQLVTVAPCRVMDTRNANGPLGGPFIAGGTTRAIPIPSSTCGIPATAMAYSLNITAVPRTGSLGYLTVWPTGQTQPVVSTLNSPAGLILANAAIVPAGTTGSINAFATDDTDLVVDINGYFVPPAAGTLQFYPLTPCRVLDTRNPAGPFGGPSLAGGTSLSFQIPSSSCLVPPSAASYSFNVTVVPQGPLGYLTAWPTGQPQPLVSTLNSVNGTVLANAAIVPAGTGGAVSFFATNTTDLVVDVNGYFAPPGSGGLSFFAATPCRMVDTRNPPGILGGPILGGGSTMTFPLSGTCGLPAFPAVQAYSLNMTVVPQTTLGYLSTWPAGAAQPLVSTLNAANGQIVANAAIVPAGTSGSINVYVTDTTNVIIDTNGYFGSGTSTPLTITTTNLPSGTENVPYSAASAAIGGSQPYTWSATGLPSSLTINPGTGVISGTPPSGSSASSPYSVTVTVQDSSSPQQSASANFSITITQPCTGCDSVMITGGTVGLNLEIPITVTLSSGSGGGNCNGGLAGCVVISSSNPAVALAARITNTGTATLNIPTSPGQTSFSVYVQGTASAGSAVLTASLQGFNSGTSTVTDAPSAFVLAGPNGIGGSFTTGQNTPTQLTISAAQLDSSGNVAMIQSVAGGQAPAVTLSVGNPNLGTVSPSSVTFTGGSSTATTQFTAGNTAVGSTITASEPGGFSNPAGNASVLAVSVTTLGLSCQTVTVGQNLENVTTCSLSGTAASDTTVTLTSNNASTLLLSTNSTSAGSASINATIRAGTSTTAPFWVYGLGNSGTATFNASGGGHTGTGTVDLAPSGFVLVTPGGVGSNFSTSPGPVIGITVQTALLDGSNQPQQLAGGLTVNVAVTSSNTGVGTITGSPAVIAGGSNSGSVQFQPGSIGTTVLTAITPAGYTPTAQGTVTVTVSQSRLLIDSGNSIGKNLERQGSVVIPGGATAPTGGLPVTLTVTQGSLLLSATGTDAGSNTLTMTIPAGHASIPYYMYGEATQGTATVSAAAAGFIAASGTEILTPSAVVVQGPDGQYGTIQFNTALANGDQRLIVATGQLDANGNFVQIQPLAGTASLSITLINSNPSVGTVPGTVTIAPGNTANGTANVTFHPVTTGTTSISVAQPSGYSTPTDGSNKVTVNVQ
jgi:sugar lactone lactonase YvrE